MQHCIVRTGLGWLYFMGLSSTARYSVLHAAEDVVSARCGCTRGRCIGGSRQCDESSSERDVWVQASQAMVDRAGSRGTALQHGHWGACMVDLCESSAAGEDAS